MSDKEYFMSESLFALSNIWSDIFKHLYRNIKLNIGANTAM